MALFKKKEKNETEDLSIIDDYKEPFTWRNFWDEHIVGRIKAIKEFLQKNGVLFFLLSPFQYKNRLILKLVLIFLGVMIGVVPRSINMVDSAKARNEASEIANAKPMVTSGSIRIDALMSSQSNNKHLLAFNILGDTADGVPSTTDDYKVTLSPARGVSDATHVSYRYMVLPVSPTNRLLLVYVDNSKQNDTTGVFNLNVHMKSEKAMKTPIEVVLSNNQKTNSLYKNGVIHLPALSTSLTELTGGTNAIQAAMKDLDKAIDIYRINESRLNASDMEIGFTTKKLKEYVDQQLIMQSLTDKSTTPDIENVSTQLPPVSVVTSTITYQGKTYSDATTQNASDSTESSDSNDNSVVVQNQVLTSELPNLTKLVQDVQRAIGVVNSARTTKYNALLNVSDALNRKISIDDMSKPISVKE